MTGAIRESRGRREVYRMTLYVVGKVTNGEMKAWELMGVFSVEADAIHACKDSAYFVGPVPLDVALPDQTVEWVGAYYPHATVHSESR